jgi:hypothetical protein
VPIPDGLGDPVGGDHLVAMDNQHRKELEMTAGRPRRAARSGGASRLREPGAVRWLVISICLSVILTVLLNVGLRAFPDAGHRLVRAITAPKVPTAGDAQTNHRRVRVFTPWKAMIISSLILTIVLNVMPWIV